MSKGERRRTRISSTIDKLPDDIKGQLDVRLADTSNTYEELAAWLKAEGYEISKSAIGRYAIRTTQAAQRVAFGRSGTYQQLVKKFHGAQAVIDLLGC